MDMLNCPVLKNVQQLPAVSLDLDEKMLGWHRS